MTNWTNSEPERILATMGRVVNIHDAKTQLSALLEAAAAGENVVIARAGKPRAKLVPIRPVVRRRPGRGKGAIWMADDFDAHG